MAQTDLERLVFSMEANLNKLVKNMGDGEKAVENAAKHIEGRMKTAEDYMGKLFGKTNVGEAIEKTFSHIRLGVIEQGATRIPVFGGALEALGPAGLTAAAGVAAVAVAMEQAKAAAEYAETIAIVADKLGVTTKALQEYHFAALASGTSTEAMDQALEEGNAKLGEFQSNIGSAKVKKVFEALGITPEEASKAKTITDLLPQISEKMAGLSAAEQMAVAKRAGLEGIVSVLRQGPEAIADLRAEAEKSGAVLDTELIQKGKKAAEALREADQIVAVNLHRAFIDLAPVIEACSKLVAEMARDLADAMELFGGISKMSRTGTLDAQKETNAALGKWGAMAQFGGARLNGKTGQMEGGGWTGAGGAVLAYNYLAGQKQREADRLKALDAIDATAQAKTGHGTSSQLVADKPKKDKKAPEDRTDDLDTKAAEAEAAARKEVAEAYKGLVTDIEARARYEQAAVDDDTQKRVLELSKQEAEILKAKNDQHRTEQIALLEKAKTEVQLAADAKKQLISVEATSASIKQYQEYQDRMTALISQTADIRAGMAPTAAERNAIAQQNLIDNQRRELLDLDRDAKDKLDKNSKLPAVDQDHGLAEQLAATRADTLKLQAAQRDQLTFQQADPLTRYGRSMTSDLDQAGQKLAVQSLEQMNTALEQGLTNWKNFGQAAKSAVRSILGDLIKLSLEKAELALAPGVGSLFSTAGSGIAGALGSLWGGPHAAGGTIAGGKIGLVGEKGPELAVGGASGTQIVPADITRGLLGAVGQMGGPASGGAVTNHLEIHEHYDLAGAVSETQVKGWIAQGRAQTLQQAQAAFKAGFGPQLASYSALQA